MSKGEILEHLGEAHYRISLKLAVEKIEQELIRINNRIAELAISVPDKKADLAQARNAVQAKTDQIDALIPDLNDGVEGTAEEITRLQADAIRLQGNARKIEIEVAELVSEDLELKKRRGQLQAIDSDRVINAWCADYTENLAGGVGVIDVNDQGGQGAIIQPGFEGAGAYSAPRDGALFPNLAQSASQIFFNAATMPGVQKWQPRYRIGTISDIENDVCKVTLRDAQSTIQNLPINQTENLSDVPIVYMDCNGLAFEDGDSVVVRYTQNGPLVVGFEQQPRQCALDVYVLSYSEFDRRILRMSPDMHTIKEVIKSGDSTLREFAVSNEKFMLVYERSSTYIPPEGSDNFNDSLVVFQNSGAQISTQYQEPTFILRPAAGANSSGFLLEYNHGGQETSYAEQYDFDGNFISRVDMTSPDMDYAIYDDFHLPGNDEFVLYFNLGLDGFYAVSQTDLQTGARINYFGNTGPTTNICVTKNRFYLLAFLERVVEIYDTSGTIVGSWPFSIAPDGFVTEITVTRSRGYIFSSARESDLQGGGLIFSHVNVYERDGDTFTFLEVVDLIAEHGFDVIPKAMPDMKKLLALDA